MRRSVPEAIALALLMTGCATYPEAPPGVIPGGAARYSCDDGTRFTARFDETGGAALLIEPDFRIALTSQYAGSGIWYAGGGWSLRGKGGAADLVRPDGRTSRCVTGEMTPPVQPRPAEL